MSMHVDIHFQPWFISCKKVLHKSVWQTENGLERGFVKTGQTTFKY